MALKALIDAKNQLVQDLSAVATLAQSAGLPSLRERLLADRLPRLQEERLVLVVLGEFNHGKTTFVNALLGANVLPTGITPTTAMIHEVRHGAKPGAEVVFRPRDGSALKPGHLRMEGGERRKVPWDKLDELVVGGLLPANDVLRVELDYPARILEDRVTLVDTPGVNDLNEQRSEITYGYVPRADAVVFLLDAGQVLKDSERRFLRDKLLSAGRDRIVFAINKSDMLDAEERAQVLEYARKQLEALVPGCPVLLISSEKALAGEREASGFDPLLAHLQALLGDNRLRMLIHFGADEGLRVSSLLLRGLEVRRRALTMSAEELQRRIGALEYDLEHAKDQVSERKKKIGEQVGAIKALARRDLAAFAEDFAQKVPEQIEKQSADDVRRYLASFIEDTWKRWLEREGQLVGGKLEALAEEIVAIVNEDARQASEQLKSFLGETGTGVDVKVDTFAYDVGVFALGAFGMGVMMVSNLLLVGGLLTLAAPLLALLFKDRADKEVKRKALENAPKVIREVARKVEPELLGSIDRFGEKLEEFVTGANEEMRRTMIEILGSTRAALASAQHDVAPDLAEVDALLARARALRDSIELQRGAAWDTAQLPTSAPAEGAPAEDSGMPGGEMPTPPQP